MSRKKWSSSKLFDRLLENKTRSTYWENIHELRSRPTREVFDRAKTLTKSDEVREKIIGIDVLAQLGFSQRYNRKEALAIFFKLLNEEENLKVIESSLSAIGHNNQSLSEEQVHQLMTFKNHRSSDVRYGLVLALGGVEQFNAIETIMELSADSHHVVRDLATFNLGSQISSDTPEIRQALWVRINDHESLTREEAILGLALRKDRRIKPILAQELKVIDNHGSIILESIVGLGDKTFIPLLEKQIELNKKSPKINTEWLVNCMNSLNELDD